MSCLKSIQSKRSICSVCACVIRGANLDEGPRVLKHDGQSETGVRWSSQRKVWSNRDAIDLCEYLLSRRVDARYCRDGEDVCEWM